jgi:hypothetical protein
MEKFVHQQNLVFLRKQLEKRSDCGFQDYWLKKKRRIRCRLNDSRPRLG